MLKKYIIMSEETFQELKTKVKAEDIFYYRLENDLVGIKLFGYKLAICNDMEVGKTVIK